MTIYRSNPLTEVNLRPQNMHVYITSFRDHLPHEVFEIKNTKTSASLVKLQYDEDVVETYVRNYAKTNTPRNHFQARAFFGRFFRKTKAAEGDVVLFKELTPFHFELSLEKAIVPSSASARRKEAVERMAKTAAITVSGANGQIIQKQVKNKDLLMSEEELVTYIDELIEAQGSFCKLSGLPLQFDGSETDQQLLASLDRIDSSRHYEKDNLQVVCRFINKWKSDMPDPEFRRLMDLVQDVGRR